MAAGLSGGVVVAEADLVEDILLRSGDFFDLVADESHGGRI